MRQSKRPCIGATRRGGSPRAAGLRRWPAALVLLWLAGASPAEPRLEELKPSDGTVLRLDRPAATVLVADPEVADVQLVSDRTLFVFGRAVGRTRLTVLDEAEAIVADVVVVVASPTPPVLTGR